MNAKTFTKTEKQEYQEARLPSYQSILLATDSSDHANRGLSDAIVLAKQFGANITATHVYAAKMHDLRFRHMEGGLPEKFRQEHELERQRDVHDDLITRGLSIISDSYLDRVAHACNESAVPLTRCVLEGKNYRALVTETNSSHYDLLIMGALGLGAVEGSRLGTVCQRVARRTDIDTLVIKEPSRSIAEGPVVVAVDGSPKAYGGLLTALSLAQQRKLPVTVVAAFDPYFHYVAFNRIAGVLSEEAGKVFRFKEQEKLHEEIIDSGLAKIYQGHLDVAVTVAREHGMDVEPVLLAGKPHDAIAKYLRQVNPALLVIGKTGIHADPGLDIGGNAENLLYDADCAVLLSQREYRPRVDVVADVTTSWTHEAEHAMQKVPAFVRNMARMAILRYAQERGHTVITEKIVEQATAELCPGHAKQAMAEIVAKKMGSESTNPEPPINSDSTESVIDSDPIFSDISKPEVGAPMVWSDAAMALLETVANHAIRQNLRQRAEKKARTDGSSCVRPEHIDHFLPKADGTKATQEPLMDPGSGPVNPEDVGSPKPNTQSAFHWHAAALARVMRIPKGFMRDASCVHIEQHAREHGLTEITLDVAEQGLAEARKVMQATMRANHELLSSNTAVSGQSRCPFSKRAEGTAQGPVMPWSEGAETQLTNVPLGFCRDMTRKAAETIAAQSGKTEIDEPFVQKLIKTFEAGSSAAHETMPWDDAARGRIAKAPDMIRGMLIKEIEAWTRRHNMKHVNEDAVRAVKQLWQQKGQFHLDPDDPRSQ
ncbi:MAG: universal stress protein [Sulfuricaulis sp.]|nr:universal stress protein [Sulfuricaulis sp.]